MRWKQRFTNYRKALSQMKRFVDKGDLSELEEQGMIKSFEYTFELAWKTLKDFLEFSGQTGIYGSRAYAGECFVIGHVTFPCLRRGAHGYWPCCLLVMLFRGHFNLI